MTMRDATPEEIAQWNQLMHKAPGRYCFLQDTTFAVGKMPQWKSLYKMHDVGGTTIPVLYLVRKLPILGEVWYAPSGPRVGTVEEFQQICQDLRQEVGNAIEVILEPSLMAETAEDAQKLADSVAALQPVHPIQPTAHTVIVDLSLTEEELLKSFRQRTRRVIRKATDAVVEHFDDESAFEPFWELLQSMSERAAFPLREKEYYLEFYRRFLKQGKGHFILVRTAPGEPYAAGAFLIVEQEESYYKDGGSIRSKEANGMQYLVQWESIKWCKAQGALRYDMLGAPASWNASDPNERMYGLVQFKTGFAPIVDQVGTFSLVCNPLKKKLWDKVGRRIFNLWARKSKDQFY